MVVEFQGTVCCYYAKNGTESAQASVAQQAAGIMLLPVPHSLESPEFCMGLISLRVTVLLALFSRAFKNVSQKMKTTDSKTSGNECSQCFLLWDGCFLQKALFICEIGAKLGQLFETFIVIKFEIKSIKT